MKKLGKLIPAILLAVGILASLPIAASAASLVGTISGQGVSVMTNTPPGKNLSPFSIEATLFSDGTARGRVVCIDSVGDVAGAGKIWGDITSWSLNSDGSVSLNVNGKFENLPDPDGVTTPILFTVIIQQFGGAGVGHWTLGPTGNPTPVCVEVVTSGKIVARWK